MQDQGVPEEGTADSASPASSTTERDHSAHDVSTSGAATAWPDLDSDTGDEPGPAEPGPAEPTAVEPPRQDYAWPGQEPPAATEPTPEVTPAPESEPVASARAVLEPEVAAEPPATAPADRPTNPLPMPPAQATTPMPTAARFDAATTQFLPRIDPSGPPPAQQPPRESMESTQFIPAIRDEPRPVEPRPVEPRPVEPRSVEPRSVEPRSVDATQHIPVFREEPTRAMPTRINPVEPDRYEPDGHPAEPAEPPAQPTAGKQAKGNQGKDKKKSKTRKRLLIAAGVVVVVAAIGAGAVYASPTLANKLGLGSIAGPTTADPAPPVQFSPRIQAPGASAPEPSTAGITTALGATASNPTLGTFSGTVLDAASGNTLWDHNSASPITPGSTNKVLTSAAALLVLDPQATLTTTVVAGSQPGTVVLVGGGDPTLNSLPAPRQSVYPGSARIDDLAAQVKAHGSGITRVLVDTSRFAGPLTAPGWDAETPTQDNYAPIQPVMLDGGRLDPTKPDTPRNYTPALAAAQALATRLGLPTSATGTGTAPASAQVLGQVHSATIQDLISSLLQVSDNVLAEELGREVARADGQQPSFAGAVAAVKDVLSRNGFDLTGLSLQDNSGLSPQDKVPARLLAQVLRAAANPDPADPKAAKLRPLLAGLPIAGSSVGDGTLAGRYQTGNSTTGKGYVRAKTGTLTAEGVNTLAGVVIDQAGRVLVFAFMTNGAGDYRQTQGLLDTMAASLRPCGCT